MIWLKVNVPILFSKVFWGLTLAALFRVASLNGWTDEATLNIVSDWLIGITGVNIIYKAAVKVAGQPK
jgi:hypothetical protein